MTVLPDNIHKPLADRISQSRASQATFQLAVGATDVDDEYRAVPAAGA